MMITHRNRVASASRWSRSYQICCIIYDHLSLMNLEIIMKYLVDALRLHARSTLKILTDRGGRDARAGPRG